MHGLNFLQHRHLEHLIWLQQFGSTLHIIDRLMQL